MRSSEKGFSRVMMGILGGAAVLTLLLFVKELPALRRYMRIERM
jgi:hypothetical protein